MISSFFLNQAYRIIIAEKWQESATSADWQLEFRLAYSFQHNRMNNPHSRPFYGPDCGDLSFKMQGLKYTERKLAFKLLCITLFACSNPQKDGNGYQTYYKQADKKEDMAGITGLRDIRIAGFYG